MQTLREKVFVRLAPAENHIIIGKTNIMTNNSKALLKLIVGAGSTIEAGIKGNENRPKRIAIDIQKMPGMEMGL